MSLELLMRHIHYAVLPCVTGSPSPVAYVDVSVADVFPYQDDEIVSAYNDFKWDTPLSASDLLLTHESSINSNTMIINRIVHFQDDEGSVKVQQLSKEDSLISVV